jgi:hypothetical protein
MPTNKKKKQVLEDDAMEYYNIILEKVEKMMGKNKSTLSTELEAVGKKLLGVKFKGVYPSDKIPKLNNLSCYCIVNVDKSNEMGSHWMAIAKDVSNKSAEHGCILYDSFGRKHTKIIPSLRFSGNGRVLDTDLDKEQNIKEENCGQRCISFLVFYDTFGKDMAMLI